MDQQDVKKAMARGIVWMSGARFAVRGLGIISTFVLARLLGPQDFGLIAMASAVIALAELIRAFSFEAALIAEQKSDVADYNTAWTLNVLLGVSVGLLLMLASPFIADAYRDERITSIVIVLAVAFVAEGFINTGTVDFRKHMDFRRDFILMVTQKAVAFAVTLILAFWLRSYWALALGTLTSSLVAVLMSYLMHPLRPRFSLVSHHKLVRFSKWMLISNFTGFLRNKTADMMLGRIAGAQSAGLFTVAYDVANLATTELVAPINRAVLPGYVKLAADPVALREGFARVLGFIALFACPVALGMAALSHEMVAVVLGPRWAPAARLIEILAIAAALNAMLTNSVSVFVAIGKPKLVAVMTSIHTVALLPLLIFGIMFDREIGAAWAHLVQVTLVTMPSTFYILVKSTPIRLQDIVGAIWRPMIAASIMFFAVRWLARVVDGVGIGNLLLEIAACVASGVLIYGIVILLLWRGARAPAGAEQWLLNLLRKRAAALL